MIYRNTTSKKLYSNRKTNRNSKIKHL